MTRKAIRVLVDGADWLADSVKKKLRDQADMQLVGHPPPLSLINGKHPRADVVVTSLSESSVQLKHRAAFFTQSGVPLVAISKDRKRVEVYDRWVIREVGLDQLAAAIREVARHKDRESAPPRTE